MRRFLVVAILSGSLVACGSSDSGGTTTTTSTLTLSQTTASITAGGTVQLTATPRDAAGATISGKTISWSTSTTTIATVSSSGLVTGVAAGTATITATSDAVTATATITVGAPATTIGAAGGTVTSADGNATVVIPAGALSQATAISITPISTASDASGMAGTGYDFGPSGTVFAVPATIKIKYNAASALAGVPGGVIHINVRTAGTWAPVDSSTVDTVAHVVQARVSHFTPYDDGESPLWFSHNELSAENSSSPPVPNSYYGIVKVCSNGGVTSLTINAPGATLSNPARPVFVSTEAVATASVAGDNITITITGNQAGTTHLEAQYGSLYAYVSVVVVSCTEVVPLIVSYRTSTSNDNLYGYSGGGIGVILTTNNEARYPTLGAWRASAGLHGSSLLAANTAPLAYRLLSGTTPLEEIFWSGTGSAATAVPMPSTGAPQGTGSFTPSGDYLFMPPVGSTVDLWAVPRNGTAAQRLTNLGGGMANVAVTPDNTMYFDWHTIGTAAHIYRMPMPVIGSTPPTTGQVAITTSALSESQPAVSQSGRLLAYIQSDATFTKAQLFLLNVGTTGATPVAISPANGFAFSPSWCGNEFVYYTYSTSIGGPYQVMRLNAALGTIAPVPQLSAYNAFDLTVARTVGDGGLHVCP